MRAISIIQRYAISITQRYVFRVGKPLFFFPEKLFCAEFSQPRAFWARWELELCHLPQFAPGNRAVRSKGWFSNCSFCLTGGFWTSSKRLQIQQAPTHQHGPVPPAASFPGDHIPSSSAPIPPSAEHLPQSSAASGRRSLISRSRTRAMALAANLPL